MCLVISLHFIEDSTFHRTDILLTIPRCRRELHREIEYVPSLDLSLYLCQSRSSIFLGHVALGDVLLEEREEGLEELVVFSEEASLGNAAWVQRREYDSSIFVESSMQALPWSAYYIPAHIPSQIHYTHDRLIGLAGCDLWIHRHPDYLANHSAKSKQGWNFYTYPLRHLFSVSHSRSG